MADEQAKKPTPEQPEAGPNAPEAAPDRGRGSFELDPDLAEAMREAEASVSGAGGEGAPTHGADEGLVRALSELTQAREALESAETRAKEAEDRLLRTAADFENYRRRMTREREEERRYAIDGVVKDLLPVLDNLERALEAASGDDPIAAGVRMVLKQFQEILNRYGVEQFSALGKPFDPNFHEAMQQLPSAEHEPGTVVQEYMRGYTLNGRLVRPAMVVVSAEPQEVPPSEAADEGEENA